MPDSTGQFATSPMSDRVAEFHLLGRVALGDCIALQRRLVYDACAAVNRERIVVLLCEHPEIITVGRNGSRGHVRYSNDQLRRLGLALRWVNRGGGCVLHAPGQLAVYPIVPLEACGWTVGEYMRRLQAGIRTAIEEFNVRTRSHDGHFGIWGRSGLLAAMGVSIQHGITCQGAFVNVHPSLTQFGFIDTVAPGTAGRGEKTTMSCLLAERRLAIKMASVRAAVIENLRGAFSCTRHHIHSGHPWLPLPAGTTRERISRAS